MSNSNNSSTEISNLKRITTLLEKRMEIIQKKVNKMEEDHKMSRSTNQSFNIKDNEPLTDYEEDIALGLLNDLNNEFNNNKLLEQFKPVIIGSFAISKQNKLPFINYPVTDIDVKICGPDSLESQHLQEIMDTIPKSKRVEQHGVMLNGKVISGFTKLNKSLNLHLLPILRAKIISILSPKIEQLNAEPVPGNYVQVKKMVKEPKFGWNGISHTNIGQLLNIDRDGNAIIQFVFPSVHSWGAPYVYNWACDYNEIENTNLWQIRNSLLPKESNDDFLPEHYPIKVFYGNRQIIDIAFSLKDSESQSILCDSFEYTFKKDNLSQTNFTIPMAKLTSLAENLLEYTSEESIEKNSSIKDKLSSWNQQLKIVLFSLKKMKGGKKTIKRKRKNKTKNKKIKGKRKGKRKITRKKNKILI